MTESSPLDLGKLANLQQNIAADVWPNGAVLSCRFCSYSERINSVTAGYYLAKGWPKHCGQTMSCASPSVTPNETGE